MTETKTPYLDRYCIDLSQKIQANPDDYQVIGRDEEVRNVIVSLLRKSKNNPLLVGDPGVGKTAILEGLALAIAKGEVPRKLRGLKVLSLELSSLMNHEDGPFIYKFKKIIEELVATRGQNLLFIDEFHTVVGAGADGDALDAGNTLKPALSRGEIQIVGATTLDEYHDYIEKDRALERRMQKVMVDEPSEKEAIQILSGAKKIYEDYHGVLISQEAVKQAVRLSIRYITDRFLPDKAFDLIDEAATLASAEGTEQVTEVEIAQILKRQTGIPVTTILKGDVERLDHLEEKLKNRVKGQDEAIDALVSAIEISYAGLQEPNRPIGVFLFLGGTGTGKTELAKALAEALFDDEDSMIRLDMSEYTLKKDVAKMIGDSAIRSKGIITEAVKAKPYSVVLLDEIEKADGAIHNLMLQIFDDGRLTDAAGRLVNFKNTIIICTSNVGARKIINRSEMKGSLRDLTEKERQQLEASMEIELQTEFRPEFLNRFEDKVIFNLLERDIIQEIVNAELDKISSRLLRRNLTFSYENDLIDYLADHGTDSKNGARPLGRLVRRKVSRPLAKYVLALDTDNKDYNIDIWVEGKAPAGPHIKDQRLLHFDIEEM